MNPIPKDMTPVYKATIARGTSGRRWQRPVYVDYLPPCNNTCPAGENIQAWLGLAQEGRYEEAWQKYMEENPLPGTHGRACYHPCESACNRKYLDQPVSIHSLDRFLGDLAIREGWKIRVGPPTGKRILVVGAGPGGLSCAYHLRRMGHDVEIRDASPAPGGMMRYGIPAYRLPRDGLTQEIDRILAMGAKVTCNYRVGDVLAEKEHGRFDAAFLAIGAQIANHLDIPAMDGGKMIHALTLLEQIEMGHPPKLGRVVGIVGGGNTAVDAARVARRLGAEEAVMIYRSDRLHMKANPSEAIEAFAEGVKIRWMSTVKQFGNEEITVEEMQMLPDGSGSIGTGKFEQLKTDSLVLAVGEHADVEFLKTLPGIRISRGHAVVQFETLNLPVFLDAERRQQGEIPAEKRKGFEEVVTGLSESEARYEASRCLSCGNCFECDNCYASCPEQAIIKLGKGHFYRYDYDLCTGCAVCYEQCPCHAIEMLPEPAVAATTAASSREATMPAKFKVRS